MLLKNVHKKGITAFYKRQCQYTMLYYIANYLIIRVFIGGVSVKHNIASAPAKAQIPLQYVASPIFIILFLV